MIRSLMSSIITPHILKVLLLLLTLSLLNCDKVTEPVPIEPEEQINVFTHVNLLRMTGEAIDTNQTVIIEGTRIKEFGSFNSVDIPDNLNVLDGEGAYLMPGLADMHMHTKEAWLQGEWPVSPLYLYLANGVTTIRDFGPRGDDLTYVLRWRDEIVEGTRVGPMIYTSGLRPGHPSAGTQDPQSIAEWNAAQGFDFLKIYSYISKEDYHRVMASAKLAGMYTAGHIPYPVGLEGVVDEGCDEIAHIEELIWEFVEFNRDTILSQEQWLPYIIGSILQQNDIASGFNIGEFYTTYGNRLAAVISLLQSNNIPLCTTMIIDDMIVEKLFSPGVFLSRPELVYLPQNYLANFNQGTEKHQLQFRGIEPLAHFKYGTDKVLLDELHRAGVPLLLSTDAGTGTMGIVPGFSIHDELSVLMENGFTAYQAIEAGTVHASKVVEAMIGEDDFGTIEIGKRADLILIDGNPLDNITNIKNPIGVMAAGKWYSRESLKRMIDN